MLSEMDMFTFCFTLTSCVLKIYITRLAKKHNDEIDGFPDVTNKNVLNTVKDLGLEINDNMMI